MYQTDQKVYVSYYPCTVLSSSLFDNQLLIDSDTIVISNIRTISSSTDIGYQGEICYDSNYIYVCVSNNSWKRMALSSW